MPVDNPPGTPSVGTVDFGADANVTPTAPASAGARQFCLVSITVSTETWNSGQGPADTGWTLRASLNLTTPNGNVPDRGNTHRVELWEQNTPSTASMSWTKSGTRRYAAVRFSWPDVGEGTLSFATPIQTNGQTNHVTPSSTPAADTASKVIAVGVVDQGPSPVTLTSPGSPWTSVVNTDAPTPQASETQSIRIIEQAIASTPSPSAVTATFTTSAVEECFLLTFVLPGVAAPTVSAGADVASHNVSTEFTRTATESANGSTITARSWTIQSGPAGVGTTIGTAAALSWTPSTAGTYTLRYSATNAIGTTTDDMQIVVVSAGAAPTVGAGTDVADHPSETVFARTATENDNGATITARAWTIQSGPAGVGSTIGTAAALSWTPTVSGTYVLRYSATNSVGTGTDDVQVVVIPGPKARTRGFFTLL